MTREDPSQGATRDRIVQAVTDLVTEEHPAAISVPAVARRAGVSVATVYRYFPNKSELLDAAAQIGNRKTVATFFDGRPTEESMIDDLIAHSWRELADHVALARNQQYSAAGRELRKRRRPEKAAVLEDAARQLGVDPASHEGRRLITLIELLASSTTFLEMTDHLDLAIDEAAADVSWAIRMLTRATTAGAER